MKTALRSFALCLLLSNSRGFAVDTDYTKLGVELATAAAKTYAMVWVALKVVQASEYVVEKLAGCNSYVKLVADNTVTPALQLADITVKPQDVKIPVFGLGKK